LIHKEITMNRPWKKRKYTRPLSLIYVPDCSGVEHRSTWFEQTNVGLVHTKQETPSRYLLPTLKHSDSKCHPLTGRNSLHKMICMHKHEMFLDQHPLSFLEKTFEETQPYFW